MGSRGRGQVHTAPAFADAPFDRLSLAGRHNRKLRVFFAVLGPLAFDIPYSLPIVRLLTESQPSFAP